MTDHPRSRGEYTLPQGLHNSLTGSSPLSRGIPFPGRGGGPGQGIIPALAGNTVSSSTPRRPGADHPRSRGEYCPMGTSRIVDPGSSPLSRGIRSWVALPVPPRGIIPALAGNTRVWRTSRSRQRDHPRSRGEYVRPPRTCTPPNGSSPLSRGIRAPRNNSSGSNRIIPALAGNTWGRRRRRGGHQDHPRSRGEYVRTTLNLHVRHGSSPLSRGIHVHKDGVLLEARIIPALAGNTPRHCAARRRAWDHPRSRGEYLLVEGCGEAVEGSSPLSRGILADEFGRLGTLRIIPALAGNTRSPTGRRPRGRIIPALAGNTGAWDLIIAVGQDHPRSRGEYSGLQRLSIRRKGSSPLSRGILPCPRLNSRAERIIPALAGNTGLRMPRRLL